MDTLLNNKAVYMSLLAIIILLGLLSLHISPIPWFDEVFFHSMSLAYHNSGNLNLTISPSRGTGEEVLLYGPVYFGSQSLLMNFWGDGVIQFRLLNYISGLVIALLGFQILKRLNVGKFYQIVFVLVLLTDTIFVQNAHSGRMDLYATAIMMFSMYLCMDLHEKDRSTFIIFIAGTLAGIAILTTPRVAFIGIAIPLLLLQQNYRATIVRYAAYGSPILVLIVAWSVLKVGGIEPYLSMYINPRTMARYTGATDIGGIEFFRSPYEIHIYLLLIFAVVHKVYLEKFSCFRDIIFFPLLLVIISFNLVVKEMGPYSAMVMPFYLLLIVEWLSTLRNQTIARTIAAVLLVANGSLFLAKKVVVFSEAESRDQSLLVKSMFETIGSHQGNCLVIAEYKFYYAILESGCEFHSIELYRQESQLSESLGIEYDYAVVSREKTLTKRMESQFQLAQKIDLPKHKSTGLPELIGRSSTNLNGYIYQRK